MRRATDRHTDTEIADHVGLTAGGTSGLYQYTTPDGTTCEALLLNGAPTVAMYVDAGDPVATNPTQTAGLKITAGDDRVCHATMTEALSDLE